MPKLRVKSAFLAALLLCNCYSPPAETPQNNELNGYKDNYIPGINDIQVASQLTLNSIYPASGPLEGGTAIDIIGSGFSPESRVFIGDKPAENIVFRAASRLSASTPAGEFGPVTVTVINGSEKVSLPNGFSYFHQVKINKIDPLIAISTGGSRLTISGQGFIAGTVVRVGAALAAIAAFPSDEEMVIAIPPMPAGNYAITISNLNGSSTYSKKVQVVDPLKVQAVNPPYGPLTGGTEITISGSALFEGTSLWLGEQPLSITAATADGGSIKSITPPAAGEGMASLRAANIWGESVLENAFVYLDDANSDARVVALLPPSGPAAGGERVTLIGYNLPAEGEVKFGPNKAACRYIDSHEIVCNTPGGRDGQVDITIGNSITLPAAYTYVDIGISALNPKDGSIAGGELVTISGHGYKEGTRVYFDGNSAELIEILSPNELVVRIPPAAAAGQVAVTLSRSGVTATLEEAFTYYNNANRLHWTSGGKINGAINGYIYNAWSGKPLKDAYLLIGSDPKNGLGGYTDAKGMVTISSPGLKGPLSIVTGSKPGYSNISFVQVDARDMIFWLTPSPDAEYQEMLEEQQQQQEEGNSDNEGNVDPGNNEKPPVMPRVFGNVTRAKSLELEAGNIVWVFYTQNYMYGTPYVQSKAQLQYGGEYSLTAEVGEKAIVAFSGDYDNRGNFIAKGLGIAPFQFFDYDKIYKVDIVIDTPLDTPLKLIFNDSPLDALTPVSSTLLTVDLGGMGYLPWPQRIGDSATETIMMPSKLPHDLGEIKLFARCGLYSENMNVPMSEVRLGQIAPHGEVPVSPMLGVLKMLSPEPQTYFNNDYHFIFEPTITPPPYPTFHQIYYVDGITGRISWMVFSRGDVKEFTLPNYDGTSLGSPFGATMQTTVIQSYYVPELEFDDMDDYRTGDWISRAYNYTYFDAAPPEETTDPADGLSE